MHKIKKNTFRQKSSFFSGQTFLVVNETKVVGKFRDIEAAKELLMEYPDKSSHGADHANRFVAEVAANGTLNRDPTWVGGQNQGLGMEAGFNKWWYSWNAINNLMEVSK